MTSKINALSTGAGGIATTADASGILEIQTNSTTAMTVSDSQVISFNNNFGAVAGLPSYQCRAWVNFNGTGTVAIRESGNVSSITDNGTGNYTVNFATALSDANYAVSGSASNNVSSQFGFQPITFLTTSVTVLSRDTATGSNVDLSYISVALFR